MEVKENKSLKGKRDNLTSPARFTVPISLTLPERVKLTLQNYRLENKQLTDELVKMRDENKNNCMSLDNNLSDDLINPILPGGEP